MKLERPVIPFARRIIPVALLLLGVIIFMLVFKAISDLVVVLIIAVVLTYIFKPLTKILERMGMSRMGAIVAIMVIVGGALVGLVLIISPIIADEVSSFMDDFSTTSQAKVRGSAAASSSVSSNSSNLGTGNIERLYEQGTDWLDEKMPGVLEMLNLEKGQAGAQIFTERMRGFFMNFLRQSTGVIASAFNAFSLSIVVPFLTFFFLKDGEGAIKTLIARVPNRYFEMILSLTHAVDRSLGNYIISVLIESAVVATLTLPGLMLIGCPFAVVLAIINGALNAIPFFGPLIAYFPIGLVVLLTGEPMMLVWLVVVLVGVQMVDNILLKPLLISRSVSVHPAVVLLAVLIGGRLGGPVGMFVAVPVYAIIQVIVVDSYTHMKDYRII